MKRNLIIGFGIVIVITTSIYYLTKTENSFFKETSLYPAIPVSIPVFVELNSLKSVPFDSGVMERWIDIKELNGFNKWLFKLDSIIKENGDIQSGLRSNSVIVALGLMGDNKLTPLVIQKAESNGRKKSIDKLARVLFPEPEFAYTEIDYAGYKIISGKTIDNKKAINYCFASGLLIASTNLVLVQQSLLQLNEPGITQNSSFNKLTKSFKSEPDVAWYVNQRLFPDFLLEYINSSSITETNEFGENVNRNHYRNVRDFKQFASWSELEAQFNENNVLLKGLTVANDSANHFLSVFDNQDSQRSKAGDILPKNTAYYSGFSFSDKELYFGKLERYFSQAGSFYKREDIIRKMESQLKVDFKKSFQSMVKNEIIVAITDIPKEAEQKTTYFIFDVNGKTKTESLMDSMLTNYANKENLKLDDLKTVYSVNDKRKFNIIEFPFPSFPGIWLGKPYYTAQAKFAVFYKDFLVFCNTATGLQNYLLMMEEGNRLAEDIHFKRTQSISESKSNISAYFNLDRGANLFGEILSPDLVKSLGKKKDILNQVKCFNWQVSSRKGVYSNELNLVFDDGKQEDEMAGSSDLTVISSQIGGNQIAWQCNIGNPLITKPVFMENHTDKENREILVQDKSNKLHQISSEGKINWSIDLKEPIMGEINQIDYGADGKLQYLFSTKSKLFLVDRNGATLDGFPVDFQADATAPVSVFDYDNNRIYRYFVPCADRKIYAYNKEGKIIEGWNFEGTKSAVIKPIQHFRVGGKDYIVFKDKHRIYIQNRRGETVSSVASDFENSRNPLILSPGKNSKIIATDTKGTIYFIDFDGTIQEKKVGRFDDDHFFMAEDLNGDNSLNFVFVDGKELSILAEDGTVLFTQKFAGNIQQQPNIYSFGAKQKKIGIVDAKANRIYLLDAAGQSHEGFPFQGATEFSIGKTNQSSKKLSLIVGSKEGRLVCYLLD